MKLKLLVALAQISLGMILAWGFAIVLALALAAGDLYDGRHSFAIACTFSGMFTLGMGAVTDGPTVGYSWWVKVLDKHLPQQQPDGTTPTTLTGLGVALVVAPQLFIVGSLTWPS